MKKPSPLKLFAIVSLVIFAGLCVYPASIWLEWKRERDAASMLVVDVDDVDFIGFDVPDRYTGAVEHFPVWAKKYFERVYRLNLQGRTDRLENNALVNLERLRDISFLSLPTHVSDDDLENISALRNLSALFLEGAQVSDAGLSHLAGLSKLSLLNLENTSITDDGLAYLSGLTNLATARFDGTRLTGSGLSHLKDVAELHVYLKNCPLSEDAFRTLLDEGSFGKDCIVVVRRGALYVTTYNN